MTLVIYSKKVGFTMTQFTIFHNVKTGAYAAVYDFAPPPTMTGIGRKEEWLPVYHGQASGLLDKARQREAFVKAQELRD